MIAIDNLSDLDVMLDEVDAAGRVSDDLLRKKLGSFELIWMIPQGDPFSEKYRSAVLEQYKTISGKSYSLANENTIFDLEAAVARPFPYSTCSPATVGDHLIAIGFLTKVLALPQGSHVFDMGAGWGNTTELFARMGYNVTAFDVNPAFCELIRKRMERAGVSASVVTADFFGVDISSQLADGVVFFESFHHCLDHVRLLDVLHDHTAPGGVIVFAGEPIAPGGACSWGVRLDGMSIWSVRRFGWMELGFSEDYFLCALARTGWAAEKHVFGVPNIAPVYRAVKVADGVEPGRLVFPSEIEATWAEAETDPILRLRHAGTKTRLPLPAGRHEVEIVVSNFAPFERQVMLRTDQQAVTSMVSPGATESVIARCSTEAQDAIIESECWVPDKYLRNNDRRTLGLAVRKYAVY